MVKPVQSPNLRLPFRIALGIAVCAFPFTLPPLKQKYIEGSLAPPLKQPVSGTELAWEIHLHNLIEFMGWLEIIKLDPKCLGEPYNDDPQLIKKLQDYYDHGITDADREFVKTPANYNDVRTIAIVSHDNFVISKEIADFARAHKNTFLAGAAA